MSLRIPHNGVREVSPDQLERIVCECGCNEFEKPNVFACLFDKLKPSTLALQPLTAMRCLQCFKYLTFDPTDLKWKTHALKYGPRSNLISI